MPGNDFLITRGDHSVLNYFKAQVVTQISWHELMNAVRSAAEAVPAGECSMFDAECLEAAAREVRRKAQSRMPKQQLVAQPQSRPLDAAIG
jgi:hypothetical protein